jgi:hypothetical protein
MLTVLASVVVSAGPAGAGERFLAQPELATNCQSALISATTPFAQKKLKQLDKCAMAAFKCLQTVAPNDEAEEDPIDVCLEKASLRCAKAIDVITGEEQRLTDAIVKACSPLAPDELLRADGVGFEVIAPDCLDLGVTVERRLVLQTDGINTAAPGELAGDKWPKVKLAEVILEAAPGASAGVKAVGLNVPVAAASPLLEAAGPPAPLPPGCVRDIDRSVREHRRVTFQGGAGAWKVKTELVRPTVATGEQKYQDLVVVSAETIFASFDQYLKKEDGTVDWEATAGRPRHTCVRLGNGHGQLWALVNPTAELHNFHLHQTKFRLANANDLKAYGIDPSSVMLNTGLGLKASGSSAANDLDVWHDTLPINGGDGMIFIVINFDAEEQLGRYVYHCHILKHEDAGLMAPMRVIR